MSRGLKIVFVLSCCFLWEAQAFSQVRVRFDATFGQEEIRIGFREQTYKVKLDESGIGKITYMQEALIHWFPDMQFYMVRATLIRFILYRDNNRKLLG